MRTKVLEGKVAVVTGGSRGIGREIVAMIAQEGCTVAFNFFRHAGEARTLEKEVKASGGRCRGYGVDITEFDAVNQWCKNVVKEFGRIDILINNAGIIRDKALMLMTQEDWRKVMATNLDGIYNATRSCIVGFLKQKSGIIINMSSVAGITGLPRQTNYSASKGAIIAFTKALAKEVGGYGVRVNAVAPGYVDTPMLDVISDSKKRALRETIPLGRLGTPRDVAACIRFLLGPGGQYIHGEVLRVDGGLSLR